MFIIERMVFMTGKITRAQYEQYISDYSEHFNKYDLEYIEKYGKAFCTVWGESLVVTKINDNEYNFSWRAPDINEAYELQQLTEK